MKGMPRQEDLVALDQMAETIAEKHRTAGLV